MKKKIIILIVLITALLVATGCNKDAYNQYRNKAKENSIIKFDLNEKTASINYDIITSKEYPTIVKRYIAVFKKLDELDINKINSIIENIEIIEDIEEEMSNK